MHSLRRHTPRPHQMAEVKKSVLIEQSAQRMFRLVDNVEEYPQFLPWCGGSQLLYRDAHVTRATLQINYRGIRQTFSTENVKDEPRTMQIKLLSGPFKALDGEWRFTDLGDLGCKIDFRLHYEFSSRLLETVVGSVFNYIANTLVDAFVKRARQVYA